MAIKKTKRTDLRTYQRGADGALRFTAGTKQTVKIYSVVTGELPAYPGNFEYGFLCEDCATADDVNRAEDSCTAALSGSDEPQANTVSCEKCGLVAWPQERAS